MILPAPSELPATASNDNVGGANSFTNTGRIDMKYLTTSYIRSFVKVYNNDLRLIIDIRFYETVSNLF